MDVVICKEKKKTTTTETKTKNVHFTQDNFFVHYTNIEVVRDEKAIHRSLFHLINMLKFLKEQV